LHIKPSTYTGILTYWFEGKDFYIMV